MKGKKKHGVQEPQIHLVLFLVTVLNLPHQQTSTISFSVRMGTVRRQSIPKQVNMAQGEQTLETITARNKYLPIFAQYEH